MELGLGPAVEVHGQGTAGKGEGCGVGWRVRLRARQFLGDVGDGQGSSSDVRLIRMAGCSRRSLKKFMEYVQLHSTDKVARLLDKGLDPNFHDPDSG